jgi:hypothetical protein
MLQTVDFKQKLWAEIEQLSPDEAERIYKLVMLVKDEFIDTADEERYQTESWQQAERDATEAYQKGGLKAYAGVDAMLDDILAETDE